MMDTLLWIGIGYFSICVVVMGCVYFLGHHYGRARNHQMLIEKLKSAELERDDAKYALYQAKLEIERDTVVTPESITSTLDGLVSLDAKLVDFFG